MLKPFSCKILVSIHIVSGILFPPMFLILMEANILSWPNAKSYSEIVNLFFERCTLMLLLIQGVSQFVVALLLIRSKNSDTQLGRFLTLSRIFRNAVIGFVVLDFLNGILYPQFPLLLVISMEVFMAYTIHNKLREVEKQRNTSVP